MNWACPRQALGASWTRSGLPVCACSRSARVLDGRGRAGGTRRRRRTRFRGTRCGLHGNREGREETRLTEGCVAVVGRARGRAARRRRADAGSRGCRCHWPAEENGSEGDQGSPASPRRTVELRRRRRGPWCGDDRDSAANLTSRPLSHGGIRGENSGARGRELGFLARGRRRDDIEANLRRRGGSRAKPLRAHALGMTRGLSPR